MTEKLTETYPDIFPTGEQPLHEASSAQTREAREAVQPAAIINPGFFRWIWEGLRASILLRARIPLNIAPGPWKLAFLVLLANLIEVCFEYLSNEGEVQFYYEGWLLQWSFCLFLLWAAWVFIPRAKSGVQQNMPTASILAWLALQCWALLPPLVFGYCFLYWTQSADEGTQHAFLQYVSPATIAVVWFFAAFIKLTRSYFGSWWRAVVFALLMGLAAALIFRNVESSFWIPVDTDAAQEEMLPGEDDPEDGQPDDEDADQPPELLEAALSMSIMVRMG